MEHEISLKKTRVQKVQRLSEKFFGKDPKGNEIGFNNYYLQYNEIPYFGILGECHYSRVQENQWEDTIRKMKMGGINVVATYIFWIHHEEEEGKFRFDGNRNIRKFVELCDKYGLYVIARFGPFDHGEVRNGGLPDWLYGKPFEVRSTSEGFLHYTRILYHELAQQLKGLFFKDGGPIIGAQIENEYMHSAAPWEMTTGISNEWIPGGDEGEGYMKTLKKIAREEGIITPFYTCTGWGGAAAPTDEMMPLWGGYAFWPWIFYDYRGEHPLTPEYIYRDNHNNEVPKTYNFEPTYIPEDLPYACCEMGGGMSNYYHYRFQLPYESVDAMANIKIASGCNFLGYYMYRGGSNPRGEKTPYLNECQCPKISYDYQAPVGEYGQLRPSYYRLKTLHMFVKNYEKQLCDLVTVLPEGSQDIDPSDLETLRYAVRSNGTRGFLFLNNYQDHAVCKEKKNETIQIHTKERTITIPNFSLGAEEEAVLPFELDIEGYRLRYATAQPLSIIKNENKTVYFFFAPEGMKPEYEWDGSDITFCDGKENKEAILHILAKEGELSSYEIDGAFGKVEIVTMTREQSLMSYEIEYDKQKYLFLSSNSLTCDGNQILLECADSEETENILVSYPACNLQKQTGITEENAKTLGVFSGICYTKAKKSATRILSFEAVGPSRYVVKIPDDYEQHKDSILQIFYKGDIGHAFLNGQLVSDNFANDAVWEIGLREVMQGETQLTIYITPLKADKTVDVSSTMAGRVEQAKGAIAELVEVKYRTVEELTYEIRK